MDSLNWISGQLSQTEAKMPHATIDEYDGLHPAELSRRISQIDLTNLRRRADTETVPPRYQAELFKTSLEAEKNEEQVAAAELAEGMKTPTNIPAPPPPTPDDHSTCPSDSESENDETAAHTSSIPQLLTFADKPLHDHEDDAHDLPTPRIATFAGNLPRYTKEELLKLNPKVEVAPEESAALTSGQKTDEENADGSIIGEAPLEGAEMKKKKKKSSGKNKKANPTGFEEFYADPPITPDEHEEECDLYAPGVPFHQRIETCIQRYRKKRNLDETRSKILTRYLMLGGVESSTTKAFTGGLDQETLDNATADEIAAIQATDHIRSGNKNEKYYDPTEPGKWIIDFEGVAKGFLSHTVPKRFPLNNEAEIKQICMVIRNFLNYVLHHGVCPEYTQDVLAARKVCDVAEKELWTIKQIHNLLPGEFNIATSCAYGGHYQGNYFRPEWAADDPDFADVHPMYEVAEAERVFKAAVALSGTEEMFLELMKADPTIVKTETKYYEVDSIDRASIQTLEDYSKLQSSSRPGQLLLLKPLGTVNFKSWDGPGLDEEDMTDDELAASLNHATDPTIESFWVEDAILSHFFVGMKLELRVHELSIGIRFFDRVLGIYCSFFVALLNERVIESWKEPAPNTRPPPTEDDPDAEESAMAAEENKELEAFEKDFGDKKIDIRMSEEKSKKVDSAKKN